MARPDVATDTQALLALPQSASRVRRRFLGSRPDDLTDSELLATALAPPLTQKRAKTVSQFLITKYGSLAAAIEAPTIELRRIVGLSEEGIAALRLPRVFAMRLLRERFDDRPIIGNWNSLYEYLLAMLGHKKSEHFRVLFLDNKKRLIADEHQADGCPVRVAVDTRKIMARALELHASGLILVHNHPSGDVTASEDDRMVTAEIVQAATMLRMRVYDHVIVGNGKCGSFKMDGLL